MYGNEEYSLCLSFRPEPNLVIQTSKSRLIYSVSILDLDPKPYENIPHQYKLDGQIVNFYLKSTQVKPDPPTPNLFMDSEDCTLVLHSVWMRQGRFTAFPFKHESKTGGAWWAYVI